MKRVYMYEDATVTIVIPDKFEKDRLRTATEIFLKNVVKERISNGNRHSGQTVGEEQILGGKAQIL